MSNYFTTVEESLVIIKKYCQIEPSDTSHDSLLTIFLEQSKALSIDGTVTTISTVNDYGQIIEVTETTYNDVYRPFIVAAKFLKINPLRDGVTQATGTDTVQFQSQETNIEGLLNMQRSLDARVKSIPKGWSTAGFDKLLHTLGAFVAC